MKAVRVQEYGGPEVLQVEEIEPRQPQEGEVLIHVLACGINPLDAWFRSGHLAARFARPLPYTPGTDVVGTIVALGRNVTSFAVGDRVMGILSPVADGGYAEYVTAPADRFVPLPQGLDPVTVAAELTPAVTGIQFADRALELRNCGHVLILGALGAVGRVALARLLSKGIEVTAGVRAGKEDAALALGATHAVAIDGMAIAGSGSTRFDCIIDAIGPEAVAPWEGSIAEGGLVISIVPLPPAAFNRTDVEMVPFAFSPTPDAILEATSLMRGADGDGRAMQTLSLDEVARAHEVLPRGGGGRKFVVVPAASSAAVRDR